MTRSSFFNLFRFLAVILVSTFALSISAKAASDLVRGKNGRMRRAGSVLYQLKPGLRAEDVQRVEAVLGASAEMPQDKKATRSLRVSHAVRGLRAGVPGSLSAALDEEDIARDLNNTGLVEFAEPDYWESPAAAPNDPQYASQWFHQDIQSPSAWDTVTGNSSVLVAVCDTGIESSHPDLAGNLQLPGHNVVDGGTNTEPVHPHGTAVAGCLGAAGNNGVGVAGVNWNVKILPVRISNDSQGFAYCSDMVRAIEWAADQGAKVINLSYDTLGCPNSMNAAGQYATQKGALLFIAAANEGVDLTSSYPRFGSFVMVGATDNNETRASFSNFGAPVELMAPGTSILTTQVGGGYGSWSGTSFATPLVAGAAALVFALSPTFTPDQVKAFLFQTAKGLGTQPGADNVYGHGLLDVGAVVGAAQGYLAGVRQAPQLASQPGDMLSDAGQSVSFSVSATGSQPITYQWQQKRAGTTTFSNISGASLATYTAGPLANSDSGTYFRCIIRNAAGNVVSRNARLSLNRTLATPSLHLPSVLPVNAQIAVAYPLDPLVTFDWTVTPLVSAPASTGQSSAAPRQFGSSTSQANLRDLHLTPGTYLISVQARDTDSGQRSSMAQAQVELVAADLSALRVYPNPWRSDRHQNAAIAFDHLSTNTTIKIFTVSGHHVRTLTSDNLASWDLRNDSGDPVASGLYIYLATADQGEKARGKLAVIR